MRRTLILNLRDKIKAYAAAHDAPYEGEESENWKKTSETGIDLDDFCMVYGNELVAELEALLMRDMATTGGGEAKPSPLFSDEQRKALNDVAERLRLAMNFIEEWANWWAFALTAKREPTAEDENKVRSLGDRARNMVIDNRRALANVPALGRGSSTPPACKVMRVKDRGLSKVPGHYYIEPVLEQLIYWGRAEGDERKLVAAHIIKELIEGRGESAAPEKPGG